MSAESTGQLSEVGEQAGVHYSIATSLRKESLFSPGLTFLLVIVLAFRVDVEPRELDEAHATMRMPQLPL